MVEQLSRRPLVYALRGFLSPAECEHLLQLGAARCQPPPALLQENGPRRMTLSTTLEPKELLGEGDEVAAQLVTEVELTSPNAGSPR